MHLAYCGFDCEKCPLYTESAETDAKTRQKLAARLSEEGFDLPPEEAWCRGCRTEGGCNKMCKTCHMRICSHRRGIDGCAWCPDYPCRYIEENLPRGGEGRRRLDALREKTE